MYSKSTPSEVPISILSDSPSLESEEEVIWVSRPGGVVMYGAERLPGLSSSSLQG